MEYLELGSLSCLIAPLRVTLEEVRHGPRVSADVRVPLHWPLSDSVAIIARNGISSFLWASPSLRGQCERTLKHKSFWNTLNMWIWGKDPLANRKGMLIVGRAFATKSIFIVFVPGQNGEKVWSGTCCLFLVVVASKGRGKSGQMLFWGEKIFGLSLSWDAQWSLGCRNVWA